MKRILMLMTLLAVFGFLAAQTPLLYDDFTGLTVGSNLAGQSSWIKFGSGPEPTVANSTALTYTGYNGGGAEYVQMPAPVATSSKVYKTFTSTAVGTNSFFYSALVRLSATTATGDYFLTLADGAAGTNYFARLFAKTSSTGYVLGIGKGVNVASATFGSTVLNFNQTYLVVVRYTFVALTANDLCYLWVNPSLSSEPATGSAYASIIAGQGGSDTGATTVGNIPWHNRSANNPVGAFDGVRVSYGATSAAAWTNLNAQVLATPTISVNPSTLSGFSYTYMDGPSEDKFFTISGSDLTGNISIAAPFDYEISETSGSGYTSPIVLTPTGGTVSPKIIYVRLIEDQYIGDYNGENVVCTSNGAATQNVTCNGTVLAPPPPDAPEITEPTNVSFDSFTANWNPVDGATSYRLDVYTGVFPNATDLFFSEYIEGASNNKALEIFNGTGADVDLSNYTVDLYSNGATTPGNTIALSGILGDNEVYVIANSSANAAILAQADITSTVTYFNGDDAVVLVNELTKGYADIIGCIGEDPGTTWGVTPLLTLDKTLVRKISVTSGNTTSTTGFPTLATEWDSYPIDTTTYLGSHTIDTIAYVDGYQDLTVNGTSQLVTGLEPNTTYHYVVRAVNEWGASISSEEGDVETEDDDNTPVELSSFTAILSAENYVSLTWVTQTETGVQGYYVYRSGNDQLSNAVIVSPMIGATNTSQQQSYVYTDSELDTAGTYYYWLQNVDFDGSNYFHGPVSVYYGTPGDDPTPGIPVVTELKGIYPNPFNPLAFIPFSIANAADVSISIYNSRGQLVRSFDLGTKVPGNYRIEWNGSDYNGQTLGNGIYYIKMIAGREVFQRKAVLLK